MKYNKQVLVSKNDSHKRWLYIMDMIIKCKKSSNKQTKGLGGLANTYLKPAYPVFDNQADGSVVLNLYYTIKDKFLMQTVHKQQNVIDFLKKITKKDFVLKGHLFEEGEEKVIFDEMDTEIDITITLKEIEIEKKAKQEAELKKKKEEEQRRKQEEEERRQQALKEATERERKEREEFAKSRQVTTSKYAVVDPFGGGFINSDGDGLPF